MQGVYIYGLAIRDDDLVSRVPLDNMCLSQVYEALRMVSAFFFIFFSILYSELHETMEVWSEII